MALSTELLISIIAGSTLLLAVACILFILICTKKPAKKLPPPASPPRSPGGRQQQQQRLPSSPGGREPLLSQQQQQQARHPLPLHGVPDELQPSYAPPPWKPPQAAGGGGGGGDGAAVTPQEMRDFLAYLGDEECHVFLLRVAAQDDEETAALPPLPDVLGARAKALRDERGSLAGEEAEWPLCVPRGYTRTYVWATARAMGCRLADMTGGLRFSVYTAGGVGLDERGAAAPAKPSVVARAAVSLQRIVAAYTEERAARGLRHAPHRFDRVDLQLPLVYAWEGGGVAAPSSGQDRPSGLTAFVSIRRGPQARKKLFIWKMPGEVAGEAPGLTDETNEVARDMAAQLRDFLDAGSPRSTTSSQGDAVVEELNHVEELVSQMCKVEHVITGPSVVAAQVATCYLVPLLFHAAAGGGGAASRRFAEAWAGAQSGRRGGASPLREEDGRTVVYISRYGAAEGKDAPHPTPERFTTLMRESTSAVLADPRRDARAAHNAQSDRYSFDYSTLASRRALLGDLAGGGEGSGGGSVDGPDARRPAGSADNASELLNQVSYLQGSVVLLLPPASFHSFLKRYLSTQMEEDLREQIAGAPAFSLVMADVNLARANPLVDLEFMLGGRAGTQSPTYQASRKSARSRSRFPAEHETLPRSPQHVSFGTSPLPPQPPVSRRSFAPRSVPAPLYQAPPLPPSMPSALPSSPPRTVVGKPADDNVFDSGPAAPYNPFYTAAIPVAPLPELHPVSPPLAPRSPDAYYPQPPAPPHRLIEVPADTHTQGFSVTHLKPDVLEDRRTQRRGVEAVSTATLEEREERVRQRELEVGGREIAMLMKDRASTGGGGRRGRQPSASALYDTAVTPLFH